MLKNFKPSIDWLLIFIPIAFALEYVPALHNATALFICSGLAIIPLAGIMGRATEHLAEHLGQGIGGFRLTAEGRLTCDSKKPCDRQIPKPALQSIFGLIDSINLESWIRKPVTDPLFQIPPAPSFCADCIVTSMTLRIRDSKLTEWTYQASWDPTTQSALPPDFKRIFDAAAALAK